MSHTNNGVEKPKTIVCTMRINGESYEEKSDQLVQFPLYFKEDGKRFKMEQTLKMLVSFSYHFDIILERIQSQVRHVRVNIGDGQNIQTKFMDDLINHQLCEPNRTRISFVWDSNGKQPDPKNKRDVVAISIIFNDMTMLELQLQVRFYKKFNKHFTWGEELDFCKTNVCNLAECGHVVKVPKMFGKPRYFLPGPSKKTNKPDS